MKSLCDSCRWSVILTRGEKKQVNCTQLSITVPNDIDYCSEYRDKRFVHKRDMQEVAWLLDPNKKVAGFIKPGTEEHKRLKSDNQYD